METNLKFNSAICTSREQSERLLALGLKKETADMYITNMSSKGINYTDDWKIGSISYCNAMSVWNSLGLQLEKTSWSVIPAWSLHRLMEMMPDKIAYPTIYDSAPLRISKNSMYYLHRFFNKYGDEDFSTVGDDEAIGSHNVYDYAVSVIGFIIKEGYFNKEYLEEL